MWSLIEAILAVIGGAVVIGGILGFLIFWRWNKDWYVNGDE